MKMIPCILLIIFFSVAAFSIGRKLEKTKLDHISHHYALILSAKSFGADPELEEFIRANFYHLVVIGIFDKKDDIRMVQPSSFKSELVNMKSPVKDGISLEELHQMYRKKYLQTIKR